MIPGPHSPPYVKLRALLSQAREDAKLSQQDVATRLGKPQSFVSKYEHGERRLGVVEFAYICKAIGVSPSALIEQLA